MRMRKKKNLLPRMERCADYLIPDPYAMPGQVALPDAGGPGAPGGAGLRQGPLHRRHRRGGAGRAAHRHRDGAGRHGGGHGALPGRRAPQRLLPGRQRRPAAPLLCPRRGGPDLRQLLRSLAQPGPRPTPPDPRELPEALPSGPLPRRPDPLQDRQPAPLRVLRGRDPPLRLRPSQRSRGTSTRTAPLGS